MPLQKRRLGRPRIHSRRSAWMRRFTKPQRAACDHCSAPVQPHRICLKCGYYKGEQILPIEEAEA